MKNNRYLLIAVTLVMLLSLFLAACSPEEPAAPAAPAEPAAPTEPATPTEPAAPVPTVEPVAPVEVKTLKLAYHFPKGKSFGAGLDWAAEEFMARTDGRYEVEVYPSSSLLSVMSSLEGVKNGVAEIGISSTQMSTDFPLSQVSTLPTLSMPSETDEQRLAMWDAQWEMMNLPEVAAEFKDYKLLWPYSLTASNFASKAEVRVPSDLKGMKVGAVGMTAEIAKAAGAAPVIVVAPQTYMNMDKGVIDSAFLGSVMIADYNIQELISYIYRYGFGCGTLVMLMNNDAWNNLPEADQKILEEVVKESSMRNLEALAADEADAWAKIKDSGRVTIIEPTAEERALWNDACMPAQEKWLKDCADRGLTNAPEILEKFTAIRAKYLIED